MSEGVLNFSLGLTTGGFLGALSQAQSKVEGFGKSILSLPGLGTALGGLLASVSSVGAVVEGVMNAIERGSELEHLSRRTDTSVASLYELQKGFKAAGLSAEDVGPLIFKMQKSLGGVNEFGERTEDVFLRMGLSIDQLKQMNAPGQFAAIAGALGRLNATGAASAASSIFGREGAATMVQLSRSTGDFSAAMNKAAADADLFERNAASFAQLERGLDQIKGKANTLFAGLAAGAAPAIQMIVDRLNTIDLSGLGRKIGSVFTAATEAFREGKLAELTGLSLKTGLEIGGLYIVPFTEKLGEELLKALTLATETPTAYLQAGVLYAGMLAFHEFGKLENLFKHLINVLASGLDIALQKVFEKLASGLDFAIQKDFEKLGKVPGIGKALGLGGFKADSFDKLSGDMDRMNPQTPGAKTPSFASLLAVAKTMGASQDKGALGVIDADVKGRTAAADKQAKALLSPLEAMFNGLVARAPKPAGGDNTRPGGAGQDLDPKKSDYKPEFTDLEKMGAINRSGTNNPALDFARRTADNTAKMVQYLSGQGAPSGGAAAGPTNRL